MIDYSRFPDVVISNEESVATSFMNYLARNSHILKIISCEQETRYLCSFGEELIWYTPERFMQLIGLRFDQIWLDSNVEITEDLQMSILSKLSDAGKWKMFNKPTPTLMKQTFHRNLKGEHI